MPSTFNNMKSSIYKIIYISIFCSVLSIVPGLAQYKISGLVKDKLTGEALIGTVVSVPEKNVGVITNEEGYYQIEIDEGDSITIQFEFIGYSILQKKVKLKSNINLTIELEAKTDQLEEVVIKNDKLQQNLVRTQMSTSSVNIKEAKQIPVFFGEVDLLKTLQLKPGMQLGNEGNAGLYVRGGGPDQNLVLMDEAVVYNASHLFGFFSLFNSDAVRQIDLYKGNFPAQYSGRLSSVIDVKMQEGNKEKFSTKGGIGLISTRLSVEGPIQKGKSSFILSGRRTYLDLYTPTINRIYEKNPNFDPIPDYYFYDINGKASFELSPKDNLSYSGYFGKDVIDLSNKNFSFKLKWGNLTSSLRWNHKFSDKLFADTYLLFSDYSYQSENEFRSLLYNLESKIENYSVKSDFSYFPNTKHFIKFGATATFHNFIIGKSKTVNFGEESIGSGSNLHATEAGIYISDEYEINPSWSLNNGLRITTFTDDSSFFAGLEPRLSVRRMLNEKISIKASYARMYQYLHLASNSGASLPNDIWYPANRFVKPQLSDQVAAGINFYLFDKTIFISNEIYYKWMQRQIDIKEGANVLDFPNIHEGFAVGKGWAYGDEIYIEKKEGKTTGWIGYTLSWTWKQFDEINGGKPYPSRYDRRHNISFVIMHKLSERLTLSGTWVFASGNAVTLPLARFYFQDITGTNPSIGNIFMPRNSFRMPSYHRMDIGLVWKLKPRRGEADLTFSIYNVYNRRNPYYITFEEVRDPTRTYVDRYRAKQVSLFPVIPSVTYNFKF